MFSKLLGYDSYLVSICIRCSCIFAFILPFSKFLYVFPSPFLIPNFINPILMGCIDYFPVVLQIVWCIFFTYRAVFIVIYDNFLLSIDGFAFEPFNVLPGFSTSVRVFEDVFCCFPLVSSLGLLHHSLNFLLLVVVHFLIEVSHLVVSLFLCFPFFLLVFLLELISFLISFISQIGSINSDTSSAVFFLSFVNICVFAAVFIISSKGVICPLRLFSRSSIF